MTTSTDRRLGVNSSAAIKVTCRAATTANITLSGEQTIDGVACVTDDRVLVKDQTDQTENGIYIVDTSSWERAKDFDGNLDVVQGTLVPVYAGTVNGSTIYRVTTSNPVTIDTDNIVFALGVNQLNGVSTFIQTLLDDTTATTARQTLLLDKHGADIASATTTNLDNATGDLVDVTGTTTITAITLAEGVEKTVRFTGSLLLTHGANLVLPDSANIQTAAGDFAVFRGYASSVVRCVEYKRLNQHGSDVASAGTVNLDTATGEVVDITGTTTITAITLADGRWRTVRFTGALTLTHGASLVLPTSANITTAAGDFAMFRGYSGGVVRCVMYSRLTGLPVNLSGASTTSNTIPLTALRQFESSNQTMTANSTITVAHGLGGTPKLWQVVMQCISTEFGFAVGDEVVLAAMDNGTDSLAVWANSTSIAVALDNSLTINQTGGGIGTRGTINYTKWQLIFRAWR